MTSIKEILAIDGGLSFIHSRWAQTIGAETNSRARFKMREDEKTPSAAMKLHKDGYWIVTDFGGDQKGRHAVDLLMYYEGMEFGEAMKTVAAFYDLDSQSAPKNRANYDKWPSRPDEIEGATTHQVKELTEAEARVVLTDSAWKALSKDPSMRLEKAKQLFARYHLKALEWKRYTKDGATHEFRSHEHYPMFVYEEVSPDTGQPFYRYYEPKAQKGDRFRYAGDKPRTYIHGMEQAVKKIAEIRKEKLTALREQDKEEHEAHAEADKIKFPEILICSGGSDALNAAACGFEVVWRNSETEPWTPAEIKKLFDIAEIVVNVPDMDATGIEAAHKLALQYLDIHTAWLPITSARGANGQPIYKDLRDYLRAPKPSDKSIDHLANGFIRVSGSSGSTHAHTAKDLRRLVETAMPYKFWDRDVKLNAKKEPVRRYGRLVYSYSIRQERLFNFLYRCGFCRVPSERGKDGRVFAFVAGNIVTEIDSPGKIREFLKAFLLERHPDEDLLDAFNKSPLVSDSALEGLYVRTLDFKHHGPGFQYFFFNSDVWKVTADGIEQLPAHASGKFVWADKVLSLDPMFDREKPNLRPARPSVLDPFFRFEKTISGEVVARVINKESLFLQYLMQTCRVHWRAELEERLLFFDRYTTPEAQARYIQENNLDQETVDAIARWAKDEQSQEEYRRLYHVSLEGPLLTQAERMEQCGHLANRLYVIGYALYREKVVSQPWAVWVMDYKVVEEGQAHGGTGKSIVTKALSVFQRQLKIDGRNENSAKNDFILEDVSKDTDLILIDDAGQYYRFDRHYEALTSDLVANRKNMKAITLTYFESPKWWFNSNFGDKYNDPSDLRRKIYSVFSDYYHKNNGEYMSDCSPKSDLGLDLMVDFDATQWNLFYNLFAQALQFHLSQKEPVLAPGHNIEKRNLRAQMGDAFLAWADVYFSPEGDRLNVEILRREAYEDCKKSISGITPQGWMKKMRYWAQYYNYRLNPKELLTDGKRIVRYKDGETLEMIYIDTRPGQLDDEQETEMAF